MKVTGLQAVMEGEQEEALKLKEAEKEVMAREHADKEADLDYDEEIEVEDPNGMASDMDKQNKETGVFEDLDDCAAHVAPTPWEGESSEFIGPAPGGLNPVPDIAEAGLLLLRATVPLLEWATQVGRNLWLLG